MNQANVIEYPQEYRLKVNPEIARLYNELKECSRSNHITIVMPKPLSSHHIFDNMGPISGNEIIKSNVSYSIVKSRGAPNV
jgi:hypothetical protein